MSDATYPARFAAATELARLSDKARAMKLGQGGTPRLFADANQAIAHVGHAVSLDRMRGADVDSDDATVWTITNGIDVLLVAWFVMLRSGTVFPLIICMEPQDDAALDRTTVEAPLVEKAHELAREFLVAAGINTP